MAKETYSYEKKRPIHMAKETYLHGKRDLFIWQKRPECGNERRQSEHEREQEFKKYLGPPSQAIYATP